MIVYLVCFLVLEGKLHIHFNLLNTLISRIILG